MFESSLECAPRGRRDLCNRKDRKQREGGIGVTEWQAGVTKAAGSRKVSSTQYPRARYLEKSPPAPLQGSAADRFCERLIAFIC